MLHRSKVIQIIKALGNQIFGVTFIKKNGDVRIMNCRARVRKYAKGINPGGSAKIDNSQFTVYEMTGKRGPENYRSVNLDTITSIKCYGIKAEITPDPIIHADASTDYSQKQLTLLDVA